MINSLIFKFLGKLHIVKILGESYRLKCTIPHVNEGSYDYVFNFSAMKHVRSERDPYALMRMTMVNVFNTGKTLWLSTKGRQ